jgi:microcystin-dependent protein
VTDPFLAEIRIFGFNFAPKGWAQCDGQLLPISQNTALFALLGTNFGGDGKSTFGLPDLQGSAAMHWGQAPSGSNYWIGQTSGTPAVTLLQSEVPSHTHTFQASTSLGNLNAPDPTYSLARSTPFNLYKQPAGANPPQPLSPGVLSPAGGGLPHNNMMPYLTLTFRIALQGIFPQRP